MKEKLTLSIDKSVKKRAKEIAGNTGKSLSGLFEQFIESLGDPDEWQPPENSGTAEIINAVPKEQKKNNYDYNKLRAEALKSKFNNR